MVLLLVGRVRTHVAAAAAAGARVGGGATAAITTTTTAAGRAAHGDGGRATREVALGSHNLVVVGAQSETGLLPGPEVGRHVNGTAGALVDADRPVLVKGPGALDRGLVDALGLVDVVNRAVDGDAAET